MNSENDRQIDELIGNALKDNVPADVEQRLRTQLDAFRCGLGEADKLSGPPTMPFMQTALTLTLSQRERGPVFSHTLTTWRWMMRSPVSRVAAAVIFVLAIGGVAWWLHAVGAAPAYADFLKPLLEAKSARYKMTSEIVGTAGSKTTIVIRMLGPSRMRSEMEGEAENYPKQKTVEIWDGYQGKRLRLDPKKKLATLYVDRPKDKKPQDINSLGGWGSMFRDTQKAIQNSPDFHAEPLGEKDIDGRRVIGFRTLTAPEGTIEVWGDPKTGMPVRIDQTLAMSPMIKLKMTVSDFELNLDLDESLFSIEPPAGYQLIIDPPANDPLPEENGLIETLQWYGISSDGKLPDSLDQRKIEAFYGVKIYTEFVWDICTPLHGKLDEKKRRKIEEHLRKIAVFGEQHDSEEKKPSEEEQTKFNRECDKFILDLLNDLIDWEKVAPGKKNLTLEQKERIFEDYEEKHQNGCLMAGGLGGTGDNQGGLIFVNGLPPEADAHYAGKGVKFGSPDRPIFWYRPKDSKKYRVIYADMTLREADAAPNVHNAQPVPLKPMKKK
jgi:outer membrane lipoprotein-sorting protein